MPSKQQDVAKPTISPVLFMTVDGERMCFYVRPGPTKCRLQPLIKAGGGIICNIQKPGSILLIDQEDRASVPENTAHRYVSAQYIHDCIEKDEQLDLEDYRLNSEAVQKHSSPPNNCKLRSPVLLSGGVKGGRARYTPEEDAVILNYISKHMTELGGNKLWQEMEKQRVTCHSWQSMKYRYRVQLSQKKVEAEEGDAAEEESKDDETNLETDIQNPPCEQDNAAPPQADSSEMELTQVDAPLTAAENTETENVEADTSSSPQQEVESINPPTDEPAEITQAETLEPQNPPQAHQIDDPPCPAVSTQPDTDQPSLSPRTENVFEDSQQALADTPPDAASPEKPQQTDNIVQVLRRSSRRQLQLDELVSSQPQSKKHRSPVVKMSSSPQKKTNSSAKAAPQTEALADAPPSKRTKGNSPAAAEENRQAPVSEPVQADEESLLQKKREKKKLGILELATKEFEVESESDNEVPPQQIPTETTVLQPTPAEPPLPSSDMANPEQEPGPQGKEQDTQTLSCMPETGHPAPTEPVHANCKVHLFIFETESQEEDSQSITGEEAVAPVNPPPAENKDAVLSLTQAHLEEDKQRIRELMSHTKQDLVCVTKALLKTSGDFSTALDLLSNSSAVSGPFWNRSDDCRLLSGDPVVRQQLQEKYSEEDMAKRIIFLEVEG
ncbi:telomeric repeat-binding factor 2-interacting protein 1 isoform 1-T2 [Aulostomus maculatus]